MTIPSKIPPINKGWGSSFTGTSIVNSFYYDLNSGLLYACLPNEQLNIYPNVPKSTAKGFDYTSSPDEYYVNSIVGFFSPCLLTEVCVPILLENGNYLLSS